MKSQKKYQIYCEVVDKDLENSRKSTHTKYLESLYYF
jgi:hypothetical protein